MLPALVALLLSTSALAADPVPVLKCPAVPEAYSKMLTNLKALQTQIKKDVNGTCEPVREEVVSLEKLLGERRKAVETLIERSKKEPLMDEELTLVREYVNDVTTKVLNTADLMDRSSHCFDEDRKKFGFSDLASITLDATALAKTVAGPWSAPIALGGQALAGIFQGLDKVMKVRDGFDFEKLDQRESFVQSLCSYYNYRQDMANLMFPARRASQLRKLESALKANLEEMKTSCPECDQLATQAEQNAAPRELNKLALTADRSYLRPLGTYTVQSVSAMNWVRRESQRIREETGDEFGIGRDLLSEKAADMDRFFFEKQSPRFLQAQSKKATVLLKEFSTYVYSEGHALAYAASQVIPVDEGAMYRMEETPLIELVTGMREALEEKNQDRLVYRIDDFERKSLELLDRAMLALQVQEGYCRFFQKAGYYNANLQYYCEGGLAKSARANIARLEAAKAPLMASPAAAPVRRANERGMALNTAIPLTVEEMSTDWAESLTKLVTKIRKDPHRFSKR